MGDPLDDLWASLDPSGPPALRWALPVRGRRVVMLLGAFDPPTRAHVALLDAASRIEGGGAGSFCLTKVVLDRPGDELLTPLRRLKIVARLARSLGRGLALANRGRYLDVNRALRDTGSDPVFVVGSDKLEQLEDPRFYPDGEAGVSATFEEVRFMVVPREGHPVVREGVAILDPSEVFGAPIEGSISSTEVRRRLRGGEDVSGLVPPGVAVDLGGYTAPK